MDATDFMLVRYAQIHQVLTDPAIARLSEKQLRGRPQRGANTVAWLVWHIARVEDVGVNRFVVDRPQVLEDGWLARLGIGRRDVGHRHERRRGRRAERAHRSRRAAGVLGRGDATDAGGRRERARQRP